MNKKIIALIVSLISVIVLVVAGTYAYWIWNSDVNKNVVFNTISGLEDYVVYDEGKSSFVGNFQATDSFCQSTSTTISFYKKNELSDVGLSATVYMDVNSIGTNISASSDVYWVVTRGDSSITCDSGLSSTSVVDYGTFNGVSAGDRITLLDRSEIKLINQSYTVWIWINSSGTDLSSLSGETIDTNVWTEISMVAGEAPTPELDEGMIPVTISADGTVTTVDKNDKEWYNYANKEWANAVLVTNNSRTNYVGTTNKTVAESDILAYYVWIPRYKYKIWTTGVSSTGQEQVIDIIFEDKDAAMSSGTTVGSYRTHPAFWWDDDSDGVVDSGEMVSGIWVGKFETSANTDSTCYTSEDTNNCLPANVSPRIVPNVKSLIYQTVSNQFATSQKFTASGNAYGLSSTSTNAHMMKNSEWGAVAYLSHSAYGINQEIYINNSSNHFTGRSGGGVARNVQCGGWVGFTSQGCYTWLGQSVDTSGNIGSHASDTTLGTNASTTGNVSGVYDMSGGSQEQVMGNFEDTIASSGFTVMPAKKYYDLYPSSQFTGNASTNTALCTLATCGGHALYETNAWYGDIANFVYSGTPWFDRGGHYSSGSSAGAFYFSLASGGYADVSWRSVLVVGYGE